MNLKRIISGLILYPLLLLVILKGNIKFLSILIILVGIICFYEWCNIFKFSINFFLTRVIILIFVFYLAIFYKINFFTIVYIFFFFSFLFYLFNYEKEIFKNEFFPLFLGFLYIFIGLFSLFQILSKFNRLYLIYFFTVVFANDTGAYFTGKILGKHPFFKQISPKKTLEGFFGGLFFSLAISILLNKYFHLFSFITNLIIAFSLAIVATIGDLLESSFKRITGVKDSGSLIPGHGGMLDRIDGVLFSSPFFLIILKFM
ncbi:hypothetical protein DRN73_05530 [Candidatus Pacearchaeota archaeon]|nr:MAG: hypothetical protein DRN73_05530 [Candidatus Pacearchaeota archaeon]